MKTHVSYFEKDGAKSHRLSTARCSAVKKTGLGLVMGIAFTAVLPLNAEAGDTVIKNAVKIVSFKSSEFMQIPTAQITSDGKYLIYGAEAQIYVKNLETGVTDNIIKQLGYDYGSWSTIRNSDNRIEQITARKGSVFGQVCYRLSDKQTVSPSFVHPKNEASYAWTADGKTVYYSTWDKDLWMKAEGSDSIKLISDIGYGALAMALSPDEKYLAFITQNQSVPVLREICLDDPSVYTINKKIDTKLDMQYISYSSDGRKIFVSLATLSTPSNDLRKVPYANRNMKICSVDRGSGTIKLEAQLSHDNIFAGRAGDKLAWVNGNPLYRTAVYSIDGKQRKSATDSSVLFSAWNSDGSALTATYGNWRAAEPFLNFDLGLYSVDANGTISKAVSPKVQQIGMEMGMVCSPDGKWYAYQSTVQSGALPAVQWCNNPKIYAKPVNGGSAVALTNTNTAVNEGAALNNPVWSPDSKKILYSGIQDLYGPSEKERPWIVYFDPSKGSADSVRPFDVQVKGHLTGYAWSPTRTEIVFEQRDTVDVTVRTLWLVDESGAPIDSLTTFRSINFFSFLDFTANGDTIYYSALAENGYHQIFKISREGGTPVKVIANDTLNLCAPQISPDGKLLACTEYNNYYEIWMGDETLDPLSDKELQAPDLDITVCPTAADKTLRIHCTDVPYGAMRVAIFSSAGVKCLQETIPPTKAAADFELSVDKLVAGAYYIKFETGAGMAVREFIIP